MDRTVYLNVPPDSPLRAEAQLHKLSQTELRRNLTFPNGDVQDNEKVQAFFVQHGMVVESIERQSWSTWVWVLVDDGSLWLLDKSHGGGGYFSRQAK